MIDPLRLRERDEIRFDEGDVVFLCEGMDDCAVVSKLTTSWLRSPKIGTRTPQPKFDWQDEFVSLKKQANMRGIKSIGFVFDAERSRDDRLKELRRWYLAAGLVMPERECVLTSSPLPRNSVVTTAYLIVPPGRSSGCIEDLFATQVAESPIGDCIDELMMCYAEKAPTTQPDVKVRVRTFLAHKNAYNTGLNLALRAGQLDCDRRDFDGLKEFVALFAG